MLPVLEVGMTLVKMLADSKTSSHPLSSILQPFVARSGNIRGSNAFHHGHKSAPNIST